MSLKSKFPNLQENILLSNHMTFRIGGPARYFLIATTKDELVAALRAAKENNLSFYLLGGGSNLLAADGGFDGLIIKNQISKIKYQKENSGLIVYCDAGTPFNQIIMQTARDGYSGAEWGFGIPGTVGGAICGNAGRLGQDISGVVSEVIILDNNLDEKKLSKPECEFAYRESRFKKTNEIILRATLVFEKKSPEAISAVLDEAKEVVKHSPPFPSAGCVFKNYQTKESDPLLRNHPELNGRVRGACLPARQGKIGVGYLIDQCGLRGRQINGAKIWEGHANYFVNAGGAQAKDVLALIRLAKEAVREKYNIELEEEIRYIGI